MVNAVLQLHAGRHDHELRLRLEVEQQLAVDVEAGGGPLQPERHGLGVHRRPQVGTCVAVHDGREVVGVAVQCVPELRWGERRREGDGAGEWGSTGLVDECASGVAAGRVDGIQDRYGAFISIVRGMRNAGVARRLPCSASVRQWRGFCQVEV